jgi:PIN domain nuclease of toxin-antitoxin system
LRYCHFTARLSTSRLHLSSFISAFRATSRCGGTIPRNPFYKKPASTALPFHHRDPFDRLLAVQSKIEEMALVSADPAFDAYDVKRVW